MYCTICNGGFCETMEENAWLATPAQRFQIQGPTGRPKHVVKAESVNKLHC